MDGTGAIKALVRRATLPFCLGRPSPTVLWSTCFVGEGPLSCWLNTVQPNPCRGPTAAVWPRWARDFRLVAEAEVYLAAPRTTIHSIFTRGHDPVEHHAPPPPHPFGPLKDEDPGLPVPVHRWQSLDAGHQ